MTKFAVAALLTASFLYADVELPYQKESQTSFQNEVLSQKSLLQLVKFLPNSQRSLLAIKGIGKVKAEIFGEELLQIIMGYCSESGLEVQPLEPHERKLKTKEPKPDTKLLSFNVFKQGKSVQEIAAERHLTASTIESHLAHFIEFNAINIRFSLFHYHHMPTQLSRKT